MKLRIMLIFLLCICPHLFATVVPQSGIESYIGSNNMFLLTPWVGLRIGFSNNVSLIFKYLNHNIRFDYVNKDNEKKKRELSISNITTLFYLQKNDIQLYSAFSYFPVKNGYSGLAFNAGIEQKITGWISTETGIYILKENSILWYPEGKVRDITLFSIKWGLKIKINKWLNINPNIYLSRNSENVNAYTYSCGLIISPKYPFIISLFYFKYTESAQYRYSGDYVSLGLNYYY